MRLQGIAIVDGDAEGGAIVTTDNLAFSLVDPKTGVVKQPGHPWLGQSLAGKVLCFPSGKGSSSGSYWLLNLAQEGMAPAAIINVQADAVIIAGAVLAGIPLVHRVVPDPLTVIATGNHVEVRANGIVEVDSSRTADAAS